MKIPQRKIISAAITLALAAGSAHAILERVGPIGTALSSGNFPTWYQDKTGLVLEFCAPMNAAEVAGAYCLLGTPDVPVTPEEFPDKFFDEHFYYAASAGLTPASGGTALLVLAVEAAFAADVEAGGQMTFSRIRVRLNTVPVSGKYRFIHPYGEETIDGVAGERIFFTDDVGIGGAPGTFDGALNSRLGPYLLPSTTPGGAEIAAIAGPVPGKLYIAEPGRSGPVTGSKATNPLTPELASGYFYAKNSTGDPGPGTQRNQNIFRIEGPLGSGLGVDPVTGAKVDWIETTDFSLMGRVYTGTLASRIDVERATYARNSTGTKLDVFASAFPTALPRLPNQPRPALVAPQLTFFDAPCVGTPDKLGTQHPPFSAPLGATEVQMFAAGGKHWGQIQPNVLPATVCVKDGSARNAIGALVPAFVSQNVTDAVTVTEALFDPSAGTLSVAASSSDSDPDPLTRPTLSLVYDNFRADLKSGQIVVPGLVAPPSKVRVLSSRGGEGGYVANTSLAIGVPTPSGIPVALNDSLAFAEDSGTQILKVLGNDANAFGATVTISSLPQLGSVVANPDGTVTFTPFSNASGGDAFTYTATVGTQVSNTANVIVNITPVNDAPTAVDDSVNAVANVPLSINVLANDSDPDGAGDIVTAVNFRQTTGPAGALPAVAGGIVTFNSGAIGTYTFSYQARDSAGITSANTATLTVRVAAETVNISRSEYVRSKSRLRVEGTITPPANQQIRLEFVNSTGAVLGLAGTSTPDAAGNWVLDAIVALPSGATALKGTSSNGTVRPIPLTMK